MLNSVLSYTKNALHGVGNLFPLNTATVLPHKSYYPNRFENNLLIYLSIKLFMNYLFLMQYKVQYGLT